jgi:hypothetical protein
LTELGNEIDKLSAVLTVVDSNLALGLAPSEGMRDLGAAIDSLRTRVWLMLKAEHRAQEKKFVSRICVRRANETCEEVLADLYVGAITPDTPGYSELKSAVSELSHTLAGEARHG